MGPEDAKSLWRFGAFCYRDVVRLEYFSVLSSPFGSFRNFLTLQNGTFQLSPISRQYLLRIQMVRKVIALPWRPRGANCLATRFWVRF